MSVCDEGWQMQVVPPQQADAALEPLYLTSRAVGDLWALQHNISVSVALCMVVHVEKCYIKMQSI